MDIPISFILFPNCLMTVPNAQLLRGLFWLLSSNPYHFLKLDLDIDFFIFLFRHFIVCKAGKHNWSSRMTDTVSLNREFPQNLVITAVDYIL